MPPKEAHIMNHRARWSLLLLACLMLVACQDRREPVKPPVVLASAAIAVTAGPRACRAAFPTSGPTAGRCPVASSC
jgi:hypothetical protein